MGSLQVTSLSSEHGDLLERPAELALHVECTIVATVGSPTYIRVPSWPPMSDRDNAVLREGLHIAAFSH